MTMQHLFCKLIFWPATRLSCWDTFFLSPIPRCLRQHGTDQPNKRFFVKRFFVREQPCDSCSSLNLLVTVTPSFCSHLVRTSPEKISPLKLHGFVEHNLQCLINPFHPVLNQYFQNLTKCFILSTVGRVFSLR